MQGPGRGVKPAAKRCIHPRLNLPVTECPVKRLEKTTLSAMRDQLASFGWSDAELDELVEPKLGIITGLQALLDDLEELRQLDLGSIPPSEPFRRPPRA
jgi:hypothetical protein